MFKLKKKVCSIFDVERKGLYEGFEVVVDKFRNSLCRMAIARNDRTDRRSGVALFVEFREDVEATSLGIGVRCKVFECDIVE